MSSRLSTELSSRVFEITTESEVGALLIAIAREIGGVDWLPLGGIENNVHTVEVASDPALALVERPINGIDALLDLHARKLGETARTPHEGARHWWKVPAGGLTAMSEAKRRDLADSLRVTMLESGVAQRPTITIQDQGTGQLPDDFAGTLLSLLASNKKTKYHQMGVYNAGGAASCRFARATVICSRLAPSLLNGHADEIGMSIIRYNPLDPDRYKSGTYEYLADKDGGIIRLALDELPDLPYGTYIKLIEYQLGRYARGAHEPKQSLWHLFHAALPDPALPLRIIETRDERFAGVRGVERRTVSGLLHLLGRQGTADYSDVRTIEMEPDVGSVTLRYYVLNEGTDPDAYTTSDQGLTITLNGQRQLTKDRAWVKRNLDLPFLYKRMVIVVDGSALTSATKRDVFSSTRETGVDTPATKQILDRVVQELLEDENLDALDEMAKQRVLEDATKTTTDRVKRQLAGQIVAYMRGELPGKRGGRRKPRKRRRAGRVESKPPVVDDSLLPDAPDILTIVNDPISIRPGASAALRLDLNAKNDFLPAHADGLSIVFGPELAGKVFVASTGRLLGGHVRITLQAEPDAPLVESSMQVALVVPELAVLLTTEGSIRVVAPREDEEDRGVGGEPNIDVIWVGREKWDQFEPNWDAETVGVCLIHREDPAEATAITRVEWFLNEAFAAYEHVVEEKRLGEKALGSFRENYEYPVLFGLFKQRLAEEEKERDIDEAGAAIDIPDDYVRGEQARMARAVLMAMEPEVQIIEVADAA